ncbi:MAG: methyltransferase domain-containing protein [Candidatus Omnitrophica bacterium]|nr:methyltransferase domain-containing protein [Candidatus Omnitrophota bacterium]
MSVPQFSYHEPNKALHSRINAHQQYSDFDLHDWVSKKFPIVSGDDILDVGCGNGNFTALFWKAVGPDGRVFGFDKNAEAVADARAAYGALSPVNVKYYVQDFDQPFADFGRPFDWVFSMYSLYYTEDSHKLLERLKGLLSPRGVFVVIGPGPDNVRELTAWSESLTGRKADKEHFGRIERIACEFRPMFEKFFGKAHVSYEQVDSVMSFPDANSFAEYYWSTLLWRDSIKGLPPERVDALKAETLAYASRQLPVQVRKQMSCLIGRMVA